ncbi:MULTISPECIES: EAL domain-containing protein [unclassified Rhizobium]|uniref:bifunctional diguanylate cyclase/phosphodiesterase n=1 Tax=unclassified Rhizobium TaxID=2613769 RepID=UPI001FCD2A3C|nr:MULTISPECIES: EAL domain-containing protein [unclassified Rhizobium]
MGLVFLAAMWAGTESDAAALDRQRRLVDGRLKDQVERVLQDIRLMGAGYRSFLKTASHQGAAPPGSDTAASQVAATATFGDIATRIFGYDATFFLTGSGTLMAETGSKAAKRYKWIRPLLQPVISGVQKGKDQAGAGSSPASRVELLRLEGRPAVVGVTSIAFDGPATLEAQQRDAPLFLVAFRFLDGAALDALSKEQGLIGARYARAADQEDTEVAFQIEATSSREPIGFIIWKPDLPGSRVIGRLVPVLSLAALLIAALFFHLMIRLRRSLNELGASEQHARHLSLHDVLTGLPNRALFAMHFDECLAELRSGGGAACVALIDLDRFKDVNDEHGHPVGDELLRVVVATVLDLLAPSKGVLARFGGDEFALLLRHRTGQQQDGIDLCGDIVSALGQPIFLPHSNTTVQIGCSIGIASFASAAIGTEEILRRADLALYDAKANGRGRFVSYRPDMDAKGEARDGLRSDLQALLSSVGSTDDDGKTARTDLGSLQVYFQGIHRGHGTGELSGAEALVRWQHPKHGFLTPERFLPIAEESGLMQDLGRWVLREAARLASAWPADLPVSVNVSPSQFLHEAFHQELLAILAETGLPAFRLELEITEAALFNFGQKAQSSVSRLRSEGVRIALDDFGTGFSSLSHLIHVQIDRIKIDRSFVELIGTRAEGAAIVSSIVRLSQSIGTMTTAEGIETEGQKDFLVALGCNDLQGFLFSRPVPAAAFAASLASTAASPVHRSL